jgi:predicted nuclease of predicted toxin-antitoxin system
MFRFLADQNFDNRIVRGLMRRAPGLLNLVRAQDVGLSTADDPRVLAWAAEAERLVLTHDVSTMADFAYERVAIGKRMPGVFEVPRSVAIGQAIEELMLIIECSVEGEWEGRVIYLPL